MRRVVLIAGGVVCALSLSPGLAGTGPATRPAPLPADARQKVREAMAEIERAKLAFKKLDDLRTSMRSAAIGPTLPDSVPPGSDPRQFNGFTYYIVPLGGGTGL